MYNFKSPQQVYSMQAFQNRRFALLEILPGKQFPLQDRSKRCLFLSDTAWAQENLRDSHGWESLWVSMLLLWIRAYSQDILKSIEGTNNSIETIERSSTNISWRYSSDGKDVRGNFNKQRHIFFGLNIWVFL